jgi:small subunit ribosomal protein S6e
MAEFKCVVNDPKEGKSYTVQVTGHHANALVGKKIGDEIDGLYVQLPGYKLKVMGGSDKEGFAMRPDLPGIQRRKVLLAGGVGFHPPRAGMRRRKMVRGDTVTLDVVAINLSVTKHGGKPIAAILADAGEKKDK